MNNTDERHQPTWQCDLIPHEVVAGNILSFIHRCNACAMVHIRMADERHTLIHHRTSSNDAKLHEASNQISQALLALEARSSTNNEITNRPEVLDTFMNTICPTTLISTSSLHSVTSESMKNSNETNTGERNALPCQEQPEYDEGMHCFQQLLSIDVDDALTAVLPMTTDKSLVAGEPQPLWTMARVAQPLHDNLTYSSVASILMYNLGQIRTRQMRYSEAYSCFTESYRLIVSISKLSPMIVRILHNLAYIQYRNGNIDASLQIFQIALQALNGNPSTPVSETKSILPTVVRHATMAATLNCLGVLYFHLPRISIERSSEFLLKSLLLQEEIIRDAHHNDNIDWRGMISVTTLLPSTLNNIGRVHFLNGNNDLAIQVSNESLRMRRQLLGNDHLDVAATIFNLAHTHYEIQEYDIALSHCQEFLRIARPQLSIRHRDVAYVLKCIAHIHHQQNKYLPAIEAYHEALTAYDAVFGPHSEVASICNKLGNLYYTISKYDAALSMYENGLQIEKEAFPPHHLNIAITLCNIAQIHKEKGNIEESLRLYGQVYVIQVASVGCSDPIVAITLSNIAYLQYQSHHYHSAYETYQEVLHIRRTAFGENNLHVAATLNSMGLVLYKLNEYEVALQHFMNSYEIRHNELGDHHSDVAVNLHNIATIFITLGNVEIAMQVYHEAVRVEKNIYGPDHIDTIPTLLYLSSLYKRNGEINGAIRYLQEVLRIQLHNFNNQSNNNNNNNESSSMERDDATSTVSIEPQHPNGHHHRRSEAMNGSNSNSTTDSSTFTTKLVVVDDVNKTLYKMAKLYLQMGHVGEYVDTMSNVWRWSSSRMSEYERIHKYTIRRGGYNHSADGDDDDDDDDYGTPNGGNAAVVNNNNSNFITASRNITRSTTTSVTTYDLYILSKLHPEMASTA